MRRLVVVLSVMSSVDVLPIMHMFVHPKIVLESSRMTAQDTDSFDSKSGNPKKSLLCLKQYWQTFVHKSPFILEFKQIRLI